MIKQFIVHDKRSLNSKHIEICQAYNHRVTFHMKLALANFNSALDEFLFEKGFARIFLFRLLFDLLIGLIRSSFPCICESNFYIEQLTSY